MINDLGWKILQITYLDAPIEIGYVQKIDAFWKNTLSVFP